MKTAVNLILMVASFACGSAVTCWALPLQYSPLVFPGCAVIQIITIMVFMYIKDRLETERRRPV